MKRVYTQTFGVAGAIIERNGKILLVKEAMNTNKSDTAKGKWNHPAGWIDIGENPIDAAKREVEEETGFKFTPTHILGIYSLVRKDLVKIGEKLKHPIKIIFTGIISEKENNNLSGDISEKKWFTPEEIDNMDEKILRDLDIKKMVKDYFSGKRYPLDTITHTIVE
jgi:ADP-ribose pyrophosphatase YjhB (NUDIX family)